MKWIVLAFIAVPTAELALLIYSGKTIGVFAYNSYYPNYGDRRGVSRQKSRYEGLE